MTTMTPMAGMWAAVAPHWRSFAEYADGRAAEVTAVLLDRTDPRPGNGCSNWPAPRGHWAGRRCPGRAVRHVVLSDLVPQMTAIAD
jgi:hypothetical protein